VRITINDARAAGICPRQRFFFERHGLDWRDFVKNGIELEKLRATGDMQDQIDRVEKAARERLGLGNG